MTRIPPIVDYTATGFTSMREMMDRYAQEIFGAGEAVAWTDFNPNNPGSLMFDAAAMAGELAMYTLNAYAREHLIPLLLREASFREAAKPFDYQLRDASQATVDIEIESSPGSLPYTLSSTTFKASTVGSDPVIFMPEVDTVISEVTQTVAFIEGDLALNEALGTSNGQQFQRFALAQAGVIRSTLVLAINGVPWELFDNYADMISTDLGYLVEVDEEGFLIVKFGDGVNGSVPPNGQAITATYKVGGGTRGQVGANTITTIVTPISAVLSVTNPDASSGGSPAQTVLQGQKELPAATKTNERAIANGDFASEALNVSGVAKAIEVEGDASVKEVLLPIAPSGGGAPSNTLKNSVIRHFRDLKAVTFRVVPIDPYYLDVRLSVDLFVKKGHRQVVVRERVTQKILDILSFDELDFGSNIRLDDLYDQIDDEVRGLEGVDYIKITELTGVSEERIEYGQSNTGTGEFQGLTVTDDRNRRTWLVEVDQVSPYTRFTVTQRINGVSSSLTDLTLTDEIANFETNEHVGKDLVPNIKEDDSFTITSNGADTLTITTGNLQTSAVPGDEYAIDTVESVQGKVLHMEVNSSSPSGQKRLYVDTTDDIAPGDMILIQQGDNSEVAVVDTINAGVYLEMVENLTNSYTSGATADTYWQSDDGTIGFALVEGAIAFVLEDQFFVDTYELLNDIEPRRSEIPQLLEENLTVRAIGGLQT